MKQEIAQKQKIRTVAYFDQPIPNDLSRHTTDLSSSRAGGTLVNRR